MLLKPYALAGVLQRRGHMRLRNMAERIDKARGLWQLGRRPLARPLIVHWLAKVDSGAGESLVTLIESMSSASHVILSRRQAALTPLPLQRRLWACARVLHIGAVTDESAGALVARLCPDLVINHAFSHLPPLQKKPGQPWRVVTVLRTFQARVPVTPDAVDRVVLLAREYPDDATRDDYEGAGTMVTAIANATDARPFTYDPHAGPLRDGQFVVGSITSGYAGKYADDFLAIFERLAADVPHARLRALGGGRHRPLVQAAQHDARVAALAPYSVPVPDFLRGVSVLVHRTQPNVTETWCRVVSEAMLAGVPVVVDNRGGPRAQIVHGETGFLCDTADAFVDALRLLATDAAVYARVRQAARAHALAHFTSGVFVQRWRALLADLGVAL